MKRKLKKSPTKSKRMSSKRSKRKSLKRSLRYILDGARPRESYAHLGNKCNCVGCRNCQGEGTCNRNKISTAREKRDQCKQCSRIPLHLKIEKMTKHPDVHKEWPEPPPRRVRRTASQRVPPVQDNLFGSLENRIPPQNVSQIPRPKKKRGRPKNISPYRNVAPGFAPGDLEFLLSPGNSDIPSMANI